MSFEMLYVLGVILVAVALFVTDRFPVAQVALAIPVLLLAGGVIDAREAVAGFSHPATVTVGSMLVLGIGLSRAGAVAALGRWAREAPLGSSTTRLLALCLVAAGISPFLNNTAVVVILLPVFLGLAARNEEAASRYLIPLSYASILGGTVTLIGTSTNLIVWGMARDRGYDALTLLSIAPLGLLYLAVGMVYLFTVGRRLLPARAAPPDLSTRYDVRRFITELRVTEGSPVVGRTLESLDWGRLHGLTVLGIERRGEAIPAPGGRRQIQAGDVLFVQGDTHRLLTLARRLRLVTPAERARGKLSLDRDDGRLVEVLVAPGTRLVGNTLAGLRFQQRYGSTVVGIQHHGVFVQTRLPEVVLKVGDILLVHGPARRLARLAEEPGLVPLREVRRPSGVRPRALVAVGIMVGVVLLAALGVVDILPAALAGAVLMVFSGCVRMDELYRELDWGVVLLLAGLIPLGTAMENSGTAAWIGESVAGAAGGASPFLAVGLFYLVTSLLTEAMSNNATAVMMTPVALSAAPVLGLDPYMLLVAVMFGASASFMTPLGYQTNAMIYGPGGYRFVDFLKVGAPLNLVLAVTAAFAIPWLWG